MNIGQALRKANKLKGKIAEWEQRAVVSNIVNHVQVPAPDIEDQYEVEGEPVYTFEECEKGRKAARDQLLRLTTAVAEANAVTKVTFQGEEVSLAEALRRLSNLKAEIAWVRRINTLPQKEVLSTRQKRIWDSKNERFDYMDEKTKQTCTLAARDIQRRIDALQETFDELNDLVERANGQTKLKLGEEASA